MVESNGSTTAVETFPPVHAAATHPSSEHALRALRMLFRIAEGYWEREEIRQAMELLRELLDSPAIRRIDSSGSTFSTASVPGKTFLLLFEQVERLQIEFGLRKDDFKLDLGPLGVLL